MFKFWVLDHLTREAWLWAWQRDLPIQETLPKTSLCENQSFNSPSFRLVVAFCLEWLFCHPGLNSQNWKLHSEFGHFLHLVWSILPWSATLKSLMSLVNTFLLEKSKKYFTFSKHVIFIRLRCELLKYAGKKQFWIFRGEIFFRHLPLALRAMVRSKDMLSKEEEQGCWRHHPPHIIPGQRKLFCHLYSREGIQGVPKNTITLHRIFLRKGKLTSRNVEDLFHIQFPVQLLLKFQNRSLTGMCLVRFPNWLDYQK